jgi:hypothetical protein
MGAFFFPTTAGFDPALIASTGVAITPQTTTPWSRWYAEGHLFYLNLSQYCVLQGEKASPLCTRVVLCTYTDRKLSQYSRASYKWGLLSGWTALSVHRRWLQVQELQSRRKPLRHGRAGMLRIILMTHRSPEVMPQHICFISTYPNIASYRAKKHLLCAHVLFCARIQIENFLNTVAQVTSEGSWVDEQLSLYIEQAISGGGLTDKNKTTSAWMLRMHVFLRLRTFGSWVHSLTQHREYPLFISTRYSESTLTVLQCFFWASLHLHRQYEQE